MPKIRNSTSGERQCPHLAQREQHGQIKADAGARQYASRRSPPPNDNIQSGGRADDGRPQQQSGKVASASAMVSYMVRRVSTTSSQLAPDAGLKTSRTEMPAIDFDVAQAAQKTAALIARDGGAALPDDRNSSLRSRAITASGSAPARRALDRRENQRPARVCPHPEQRELLLHDSRIPPEPARSIRRNRWPPCAILLGVNHARVANPVVQSAFFRVESGHDEPDHKM